LKKSKNSPPTLRTRRIAGGDQKITDNQAEKEYEKAKSVLKIGLRSNALDIWTHNCDIRSLCDTTVTSDDSVCPDVVYQDESKSFKFAFWKRTLNSKKGHDSFWSCQRQAQSEGAILRGLRLVRVVLLSATMLAAVIASW